jgi:hypothetical protein
VRRVVGGGCGEDEVRSMVAEEEKKEEKRMW